MDKSIFKKKISIEETKMNVVSDIDSENVNLNNFIVTQRNILKKYIANNPLFFKTLRPYKPKNQDISSNPKIIRKMIEGSKIANVGPTATLAGTIAELSLDYLTKNNSNYSILENGGDIAFLNNYPEKKVIFGIYAGESPLSGEIGFEFKYKSKNEKMGICTSSGSVGYSISYGRSDCVTVISKNACIADGLATSIGNNVNGVLDQDAVENGLSAAEEFREHFIGALIIVGESIGTIGKLPKIVETNNEFISNDFEEK
ncbi:UPF0280 family protein [uncultured Methanobrevibacter sp.]|uniref:UPF0280 family protein n=2 Tax=Methanobrevibacter TaxID=2172 RepID=UPI002614D5C0|nr:UPF0280 family protein [uncultured Methanobrevibacter sp.]